MRALLYQCDHLVDMFDQVEVLNGNQVIKGLITGRHPRNKEVSVHYDTGEVFRTSGKPVLKTERFPLKNVELVARDG